LEEDELSVTVPEDEELPLASLEDASAEVPGIAERQHIMKDNRGKRAGGQ